MNIQKFLDTKHGKFIGRVYLLVLLFIGNAFIPIGAVSYYLNNGSPLIMCLGIIITIASVAILSTPFNLKDYKEEE